MRPSEVDAVGAPFDEAFPHAFKKAGYRRLACRLGFQNLSHRHGVCDADARGRSAACSFQLS